MPHDFPALAFRRVSDRYAHGDELVAKAIGSLEIPGGAGVLTLLEHHSCARRQIEIRSGPVEIQPEDLVPSMQQASLVHSFQPPPPHLPPHPHAARTPHPLHAPPPY